MCEKKLFGREGRNDFSIDQGVLLGSKHVGKNIFRSGTVDSVIFQQLKQITFYEKKTVRTDGSEVKSLGIYFVSDIFVPLKYSLVNIKVVWALVPVRNFFSRKVIHFSCKKANERTVPERNLAVYIFFCTYLLPQSRAWSI